MFIVFFAPVVLAVIKKFGKKMRRASKKALVSSSVMLGQIEGSLTGIRVVKGAGAERFERRRYTRIMDKLVEETLRMSRIDSFSEPTVETLTLFVVGVVVLFASYMVFVTHSLDVPRFFLIMACLASIGDSLRRVSKVNNVLQRSNAAATRIFEVLDLPSERVTLDAAGRPSRNERGVRQDNGGAESDRSRASSFRPLRAKSALKTSRSPIPAQRSRHWKKSA